MSTGVQIVFIRLCCMAVNEKPPDCKLPHDWLVMLSTELATFWAI